MRILLVLWFVVMFGSNCFAQGWRGIEPLRSTCEDVKRTLQVAKCEYPNSTYRLQDEKVTIGFVSCPCPTVCYSMYGGWNVPPGTVAGIKRQLLKPVPLSEFDVNSNKWTKTSTDMIGQVLFDDHDAGITLDSQDGQITSISYYAPLEKNQHLLCPKCTTPKPSGDTTNNASSWVHGYSDLAFEEEKPHLDKFAIKLQENGSDSRGYIVAYGSCRSRADEVQRRVARAKQYLIAIHGIQSRRIAIIYGGQHETFEIELHVRRRSLPPPRTFGSTYPAK